MAYEAYKSYLDVNSKGIRDKNLNHTKRVIESSFSQSPSYFQVEINDELNQEVWINDDGDIREQKKIIALDYPLEMGAIIKWNDQYWLCIHSDDLDIYRRGVMLICHSDIKWLDENGDIVKTPFSLRSEISSNFGIQEGRIMMMPNERRQITISKNIQSEKLKKNRRFIIDDRAWKIVGLNRLINGLINITLEEQEITASDNLELGIADYYSRVAEYQLTVLNGDYISIENKQTLQINAEVKNRNEVINVDDDLIFTIDDESKATISPTGLLSPIEKGLVKVSVSFRDIKKTIQVNITASTTNNYSCEIVGDDSIKYNMIKNYRSTIFNNGIERDDITLYWITDIDGSSPSSFASILEQDQILHTCKIKANNKKGFFLLHCENRSKLAYTNKKIEIKSII